MLRSPAHGRSLVWVAVKSIFGDFAPVALRYIEQRAHKFILGYDLNEHIR